MHRKVKGLLSLILTFAMVTAAAAPVSADELSEHQPAEEQPIVEEIETQSVQEENEEATDLAEELPPAEPEVAKPDLAEVQHVPVEKPIEEQPIISETELVEVQQPIESEIAQPDFAEVQPVPAQEQLIAETVEAETVPVEQDTAGMELVLVSSTNLDYMYDNLTEEQKQFRVYAGTDMSSELTFMDRGVTPDAENLNTLAGSIAGTLLANRQGDLQFYRLSGWKLWKVDSSGGPDTVCATSTSYRLSDIATKNNFEQAAYMVNNGTGTNPVVICQKPILEPVWSCYPYAIPIYDKDGNNTGTTLTVTAENYNNVVFPTMEADGWKLIYNGTECRLNTPGEIWTNEINGIRTVGRDFNEFQARLQAETVVSLPEEDHYEVIGPQGNEGWYVGAVTVHAKDGYQIRLAETDLWSDAVSVTESGNVTFYLKALSETELQAVTLSFWIDQTAPEIIGVQNGETYYNDALSVVVTDAYLHTVMVNGGAVGVFNNRADILLNPSEQPYIIQAVDMAGNQREYTVLVKAADDASSLQDGIAEFIQPGWYVGETMPNPVVVSATNGIEHITYYYKEAGADDSAYTTVVPDKAGKYTAKAVFAKTELYREVIKTSDFEISYLTADDKYKISGSQGVEGWYRGEITVQAEGGYQIRLSDTDAWTESVLVTKSGDVTFYLKRADSEVQTQAVTLSFQIDAEAPVISGVSDGEDCYGDEIVVKVTDAHLRTVTVNGVGADVSDNHADITLKPSDEAYKIIAEDMAGNQTQYTVEVWETWVRDGIITNGKKKLRRERMYKLGSGQWTVDGDGTIYNGGGTFYTKNGGEYDFTRK